MVSLMARQGKARREKHLYLVLNITVRLAQIPDGAQRGVVGLPPASLQRPAAERGARELSPALLAQQGRIWTSHLLPSPALPLLSRSLRSVKLGEVVGSRGVQQPEEVRSEGDADQTFLEEAEATTASFSLT